MSIKDKLLRTTGASSFGIATGRRDMLNKLFTLYTTLIILVLLFPLFFLVLVSLHPQGLVQIPTNPTLDWYFSIFENERLIQAFTESIKLGMITSLTTTALAFFAARGTMQISRKSSAIGFFLLPLFLPGVSLGFSLSVYFKMISLDINIWTKLVAHILWTFPFAYIIIFTTLTSFNPQYKEAAYDLGASQYRAFMDVELPHIKPGILGALIFSFTLSFNEFSRTSLLRGDTDTFPTYVWSRVQNVGIDPITFAISGLTIIISAVLLITFYLIFISSFNE